MTNEKKEIENVRALELMNRALFGQHGIALPALILRDQADYLPDYLGTFVVAEMVDKGIEISFTHELILWSSQMNWRTILRRPSAEVDDSPEKDFDELYIGSGRNMMEFGELLKHFDKSVAEGA